MIGAPLAISPGAEWEYLSVGGAPCLFRQTPPENGIRVISGETAFDVHRLCEYPWIRQDSLDFGSSR